ncbi:PAQR family membrane homeostasis protein TrhA [Pseudonocardia spinosispora]|uniref:PAQR family membrane homeostasis protein TrhA n=1 Tax=Pseudonocardia spinosispora TaxID=103441 RepID=UPI0004139311|nr:hemolysin III family protein [Pseudonocardia spinosispora]
MSSSGPIVDTVPPLPPKPRFRGRLHQGSFVFSLAAGATMITAAAAVSRTAVAVISVSVYAATVLGLFGISALYHRGRWKTERARARMRRLDHSMIFVFIAGTYTPVSAMALPSPTSTVVLAVVWIGALGGVALQLAWPGAPRWVGVPIYLALGWVAVFVLPDLLHHVGVAALVLILAGGALYTAGAVVYAIKRPNPWPNTFGFHEFFHAATVLAAVCHYVAIWFVLVSTW